MKKIVLLTLLSAQTLYAQKVTCFVQADGPSGIKELEFSNDITSSEYFFEEKELNEIVYASVTYSSVSADEVSIDFIMTTEDDYATQDTFNLKIGESELIESDYYDDDNYFAYSLLCSVEK